jgi:soluble lytic murein transglycosylase-like protein
LKELLDRYDGNLDSALVAYNAGSGRVDRGGTLPRETREYLARVKRGYREFVG